MENKRVYGIIYKITNKISGKIYIGQSVQSLKERIYQHIYSSKNDLDSSAVHFAIKKYGENSFTYEVIDQAYSEDELNELEIFYIDELKTLAPKGYNISKGGLGHSAPHTEQTKLKISLTLKEGGHKPSKECTSKANEARRGTHHSEESKKKMSESLQGKEAHNKFIPSEEQKQLILSMLADNKTPREISMELFGEYRKTMIYRLVKEYGYVTTPSSGEQTVQIQCKCCGKMFEDFISKNREFCSKSCRAVMFHRNKKENKKPSN